MYSSLKLEWKWAESLNSLGVGSIFDTARLILNREGVDKSKSKKKRGEVGSSDVYLLGEFVYKHGMQYSIVNTNQMERKKSKEFFCCFFLFQVLEREKKKE